MKQLLITILFLFYFHTVYAQHGVRISGKIIDKNENPIEIGDVLLLSVKDAKLVKYTTITNGYFSIDAILQDSYYIKIMCLGFKEYSQLIDLKKDLEVHIKLEESETILGEIEIVADKKPIENKNGNILVNVANTIFSSESNTIDLLSKLPAIQISSDRNSIHIIGKGNPLIYVGNQRISLEELKSISIDVIEHIEIIKNPSSKYEASGKAVILITKKQNNEQGIKVSLAEIASFKTHFNNYFSSNISVKRKKLEVSFHTSYNQLKVWESNGSNYEVLGNNISSNYMVKGITTRFQFIFGGGLFYNINKTDYISVGTKITTQKEPFTVDANSFYREGQQAENVLTHSNNDAMRLFSSTNINYSKSFARADNLFLGAQYTTNNQKITTDIFNNYNATSFIKSQYRFQKFTVTSVALKANYEKKFDKKKKVEIGGSFVESTSNSLFTKQVFNPIQEEKSDYKYVEKNKALYFQILGKTKKISYSAGLRVENTDIIGAFANSSTLLLERKNTYLFPKIKLTYAIDSLKNITFNYAKSIVRPNFSTSSPITVFINPYLEISKNINLKPTLTNEVSATFQLKNKSITARYYHTKNPVYFNLQFNENTNRTTMSPSNFMREFGFNIDVTIPSVPRSNRRQQITIACYK